MNKKIVTCLRRFWLGASALEQAQSHVLIVSFREESVYAGRSLRAGAGGYLTKRETTSDSLLAALWHVFLREIPRLFGNEHCRGFAE